MDLARIVRRFFSGRDLKKKELAELDVLARQVLEPHTACLPPLSDAEGDESYKEIVKLLCRELLHFREREDEAHKWKPGTGKSTTREWLKHMVLKVAAFHALEQIFGEKPEYKGFFCSCLEAFLAKYIRKDIRKSRAEMGDVLNDVYLHFFENLGVPAKGGGISQCAAEFAQSAFDYAKKSIYKDKGVPTPVDIDGIDETKIRRPADVVQSSSREPSRLSWISRARRYLKRVNSRGEKVIKLRYDKGHSFKEIDNTLETSDGHSKEIAHRARQDALRGRISIEVLRLLHRMAARAAVSGIKGQKELTAIRIALGHARCAIFEDRRTREWVVKKAAASRPIHAALKKACGRLPTGGPGAAQELWLILVEAQVELPHVVLDHAYRALWYLRKESNADEIPPEDLVPLRAAWWVLCITLLTTPPPDPESEELVYSLIQIMFGSQSLYKQKLMELAQEASHAVCHLDEILGGLSGPAGERGREAVWRWLAGEGPPRQPHVWMLLRAFITADGVPELVAGLPPGIVADGLKALVARGNDPQAPEEPRRNGDNDNGL